MATTAAPVEQAVAPARPAAPAAPVVPVAAAPTVPTAASAAAVSADAAVGASSAPPSAAAHVVDAAGALESVGSLFSGWMSAASAAAASAAAAAAAAAAGGVSGDDRAPVSRDANGSAEGVLIREDGETAAAQSSPDLVGLNPNGWLEDAGKMWETALRDVGERMEAVKLEETVAGLRDSSTSFLDDVSKNIQNNLHLDADALRQRADELQTSTRVLLANASEKIHERTREAMDIFVDKGDQERNSSAGHPPGPAGHAPWDKASLPEAEHKFADKLREEMVKLAAESIYSKKKRTDYFLSGAAQRANFKFNTDADAASAIAALEADQNMRRLRAGLVPQKIPETTFWDEYFYQVSHLRALLVANNGIIPVVESMADSDEKVLFGDDDDEDDDDYEEIESLDRTGASSTTRPKPERIVVPSTNTVAAGSKSDGDRSIVRDWEGEIDALFDPKE
jgi:hypothetical protein